MMPNENFRKYLADIEFPEIRSNIMWSSCLRVGAFLVKQKIMENYEFSHILIEHLGVKSCGLFMDLAAYSIIGENNVAQYYPDYAYNHPLFILQMHAYSNSKI